MPSLDFASWNIVLVGDKNKASEKKVQVEVETVNKTYEKNKV